VEVEKNFLYLLGKNIFVCLVFPVAQAKEKKSLLRGSCVLKTRIKIHVGWCTCKLVLEVILIEKVCLLVVCFDGIRHCNDVAVRQAGKGKEKGKENV